MIFSIFNYLDKVSSTEETTQEKKNPNEFKQGSKRF